MKDGQRCGDCVFFRPQQEGVSVDLTKKIGECRRNPPLIAWFPVGGQLAKQTGFPAVEENNDGCGEFVELIE